MSPQSQSIRSLPREAGFDSTLAFLRDPYRFISKRCRAHESDVFETRLQCRKVICMMGKEAAEVFYDPQRFHRKDAAPKRIQKTLFGVGGAQGLDGEAHWRRKRMFLDLMQPERVEELTCLATEAWRDMAHQWAEADSNSALYDALQKPLTRAVCLWAGVPLSPQEDALRARQLTLLFDAAGSIGLRHWRARHARNEAERWAGGLVERAHAREIDLSPGSALSIIADHRDETGRLLDSGVAAVELLNVLRPTVAVSVYLVFVALALRENPTSRERIASGDAEYARAFAQEVRRFYPFFPAVVARVRRDFAWQGYHFPQGRMTLLDLYGTNHDARSWDDPEAFRPERFARGEEGCPFSFIPQGGGQPQETHRCPGEPIAVALMERFAGFLSQEIEYNVPEQDLSIDWRRLPALPRSRFLIDRVKLSGNRGMTSACPRHHHENAAALRNASDD